MCHSDRILAGHSLKGGTRSGHFDSLGETASMHACLQRCCSKHTCDVALLVDGSCFGVACYSKELCEPIPVPHPHFVFSQLGFISKGQKRGDIEKNQGRYSVIYTLGMAWLVGQNLTLYPVMDLRNVTYVLLTKREVKMAGYWPSSFCVFMERDEVKVHKNANEANIQPS